MAKYIREKYLEIPHHFVNNLYFGGPHEPTGEHLALLNAYLEKSVKPADRAEGAVLTGYVAQKSYGDVGNSGKVGLPDVPNEETGAGGYSNYTRVDQPSGDSLLACVEDGDFNGNPESGKMWMESGVSGEYLQYFTRGVNKNERYDTQSTYYLLDPSDHDVVVRELAPGEELVSGSWYRWAGWGIMYATGKNVPETSDYGTENGYPEATMGEQILKTGDNIFTFVYAGTTYTFQYYPARIRILAETEAADS